MSNEDWGLLQEHVRQRIDELDLKQADIQAQGGPSPAKVREIVNGRATTLSPSKRRDLERALLWKPGSIDHVLAGDEPTELVVPDHAGPPPGTGDDGPRFLYASHLLWQTVNELADSPVGDPLREWKGHRAVVVTADVLTDALLGLNVGTSAKSLIREMGTKAHDLMKDQIHAPSPEVSGNADLLDDIKAGFRQMAERVEADPETYGLAARTAPPTHRKGQSDQGDAGGEENQDKGEDD